MGEKECGRCQDVSGFYLGVTCPECNRPFRSLINDGVLEPKQHVELINENIDLFDEALIEYKNKKNKFKQDLNSAMNEAHQTGRSMNKETLEEAANNFANLLGNNDEIIFGLEENAFIEGAKWQTERMYSEEEVLELLLSRPGPYLTDEEIKEWFEQFKKK